MNPQLLIVLAASFGTVILGLFTYYKNPKSATNNFFLLFTLTLAGYLVINFLSSSQNTSAATFFWVKQVMSIASLINLTFFFLVKVFPASTSPFKPQRLTFALAFTALVIILAQLNLVFSSVTLTPTGTHTIPSLGMPIFLLQTLTFLGLGFFELVRKYRSSEGVRKTQIKFLLAATILMFAAILITNLFFVLVLQTSAFIDLLPIYTFVFVSIISYAIIRHRFLDINLLVARAVTYSLLTLIIALIYTVSLFTIPNLFPNQSQTTLTVLIGLILVYTFNPLRRVIEKLTQNVFYKLPYSSDTLLETLGEIIRATLSLDKLGKDVLSELCHTIHISQASLVILQENQKTQVITYGYDQKPDYTDNTLHNLQSVTKGRLLVFDDLEESTAKMLLRNLTVSVVMPLKVKSIYHGFLLLGEKASGEIYSPQDIDVLEILIPQLSIATQNAKSYEEIKGFADTLKLEVARATTDLKKANRDLRHLDKLKDDFVFIATHELKNPVTAMRGYLSMLQEGSFGPIPDPIKDPLNQLQASNQQLVDLVNDLLQIARAEAKTITINTQPIPLCTTVDQVLETVKPLVDQKKLNLVHNCPKTSLKVLADEQRLKEIVNNLVSNAIKYSDQGIITISYELKGHEVITHIQDQGAGIPAKDKEKIFTRFFRVEEEAAKGIPGTGLGLFIVKQLIEKMGGKIWFDSIYNQGTTFSFSLPIAKPNLSNQIN